MFKSFCETFVIILGTSSVFFCRFKVYFQIGAFSHVSYTVANSVLYDEKEMSVVSTSGGSLQLPPIPLRYSVPSADETTYVHFVTKGISTLDFDLAPSLRLLSHHFLKASFSKPLILLLFPEVALTKKLSYLQLCYLCVRHAFILPLQN